MSRPGTSMNGQHGAQQQERSYFEQQREAVMQDVAINLEHVLQNMNKLNRSLEGIIAVGNEFSQVEGLWSQFENVMAKDGDAGRDENASAEAAEGAGSPNQARQS